LPFEVKTVNTRPEIFNMTVKWYQVGTVNTATFDMTAKWCKDCSVWRIWKNACIS